MAATGFVIREKYGRLLIVGGRPLLRSSVPYAELVAALPGVQMAIKFFNNNRLCIEGNSFTVFF